MSRYEPPRVSYLGVVSSPLVDQLDPADEDFSFRCTALERVGSLPCGSTSPVTKDVREVRDLAIAVGWRLSGSDEPSLFNGEALCPAHRHCSITDVLARHARPPVGGG